MESHFVFLGSHYLGPRHQVSRQTEAISWDDMKGYTTHEGQEHGRDNHCQELQGRFE